MHRTSFGGLSEGYSNELMANIVEKETVARISVCQGDIERACQSTDGSLSRVSALKLIHLNL